MGATPASKLHEIVLNANDLAPSTRTRYLCDLNQWITFAGPDPAGWTRTQASAFYRELLTRMRPQSANRLMASLSYASRWWAYFGNDPQLHFAKVQAAPSKDKKPQIALSEPAARALLDTCDQTITGVRDFALIVVGLETGMRYMSLAGMTIEDTILTHNALRFPCPAAFVPLKGKDPAWVPLSDTAIAALGPWLATLGAHNIQEGPLFRPLGRELGRWQAGWFPKPRVLSRSAISCLLDGRTKAAGLPRVNPHLLRHTFVTWRANAGLQPHEIAAITHHDTKQATGALGGYIDQRVTGTRVRNSTPAWLTELVGRREGVRP